MEVKITPKKENSQVKLEIIVPTADFKPYIEKAAKQLSADNPLKGFRPGKAPASAVAESLGREKLLKEAMDKALPHFFVKAAIDNEIEAINRPSITVEKLGMDEPLHFIAVVDVLPEIELEDLSDIKADKRDISVTDEDVDKELNHIAKTRSKFIDVPKEAEEGDTVTVDFAVSMNGTVIEGGESQNHPVTIGEGYFVPDFEKNLLGIKASATRSFEITFPEDFAKKDLRGKKANVQVTAKAVQKRVLPEINDDFAKSLGQFKDLQHLKQEFKKGIAKEKETKENERYQGELAEQLAGKTKVSHIPDILIEKEIDRRLDEFTKMLAYQQKTIEDYLKAQNKEMKDIRDEMRPAATKNIKIHLALKELAKRENIQVTKEEVEAKAAEYLQQFKSVEEAQQNVDPQELHQNLENMIRNQKTLKKLEELAEK